MYFFACWYFNIITWKTDVPKLLSRWFCSLGPKLAFYQANQEQPLFRMGMRPWGQVRCDVRNWSFSISWVGGKMSNKSLDCFRKEYRVFWMLFQEPPNQTCSNKLVLSAWVHQKYSRATTCRRIGGNRQNLKWSLELDTRARQCYCFFFARRM